jgi:CheY-like chemotaxis protein
VTNEAPCRTVLVVEDDLVLSDILRLLLEDDGYRILVAHQGKEAIQIAGQERPDLITLDLRLPDVDGRYVLDQLQQRPELRGIPVIIISGGEYQPRTSDTVLAILPKPFDAMELDRLVRNCLKIDSSLPHTSIVPSS